MATFGPPRVGVQRRDRQCSRTVGGEWGEGGVKRMVPSPEQSPGSGFHSPRDV